MAEQRLDVHFEELRLAIRDTREAADTLAGQVNEHLPACAAASDHHQGWETAEALNECVNAWAAHLHGHVEETHGIGQRFHRTHANYVNGEQVSQEDVGGARLPQDV